MHFDENSIMNGDIDRLERARRRLLLRQSDVAAALGITQGHYCKVVARVVPLTDRLGEKIASWLDAYDSGAVGPPVDDGRIAALAASIQAQCAELLALTSARTVS